jgi:type I restriction enzyme, S subunit
MKLPKGWQILSMGEIGEVQAGRQVSPHFTNGKLRPYLRVANVQDGWIDFRDVKAMPFTDKEATIYELAEGDILLSEGQSLELVGRPAMYRGEVDGCCFQNTLVRLRTKQHSASFVLHLCKHLFTRGAFQRIAKKTTSIAHLGVSRFAELSAFVPPLPEQRKIADILTTWDEALTQLDALIEAQERRKKALMQRLLSRSSAHSQTSHAQHRLGDVIERVTRRNTVGSTNVLTISAQGGLVNQQEYFNRSVAAEDLSGYYLLRQGEFAYNRSSAKGYPFGAIKRLDNYDQGVVSTLYLCFRLRDGSQASSAYLCHYFEGGYLNSGLRMIAKEGARAHGLLNVTADEFFDLDIFLPTLPEQQKIAEILDTADQQLTLLRTQRTALDQQKRGLMQRLLTGKLRVSLTQTTP